MINMNEEIEEWKKLLNSGYIDQNMYDKEVNKILRKEQKRQYRAKAKTKGLIKANLITKTMLLLLSVTLISLVIYSFSGITIKSNATEKVTTLDYLKAPIQMSTSGNQTINMNNTNVKLTYVAKYTVYGRVVTTRNYYGYNIENKLSPKDAALAWGFLADKSVDSKINRSSLNNRFCNFYVSDGKWLNSIGGTSAISKNFSNNHLIPSDNKTKKLIKSIKKGDYVKIEGYLVNAYSDTSNGEYFYWNTSTSRTDTGNGACELIYVTNVTWLELEK